MCLHCRTEKNATPWSREFLTKVINGTEVSSDDGTVKFTDTQVEGEATAKYVCMGRRCMVCAWCVHGVCMVCGVWQVCVPFSHTHTQAHTQAHTHKHTHTRKHTRKHKHKHAHTQAHTSTQTQTHKHTHKHTHTQTHSPFFLWVAWHCQQSKGKADFLLRARGLGKMER